MTEQPKITPEAVADLVGQLRSQLPADRTTTATMIEALAADREAQKARADAEEVEHKLTQILLDREAIVSLERLAQADAAEAKVAKLVEVLTSAAASLAAAISLLERGGKKAAPSDQMFNQMLIDYNLALDNARSAIREVQE